MRTDIVQVTTTLATPQVSACYGFACYPDGAAPAVFPLTARIEYEDGGAETLSVRSGVLYAGGRKVRTATFAAVVAGAVAVDLMQAPDDYAAPQVIAHECRVLRAWSAGDAIASTFDLYPPGWARTGAVWFHQVGAISAGGLNAGLDLLLPGGVAVKHSASGAPTVASAANKGELLAALGVVAVMTGSAATTALNVVPGPLSAHGYRLSLTGPVTAQGGGAYARLVWGA